MTAASLEEVVPGERLVTAEGSCYVVRREYPVCHHYGGRPLELARSVGGLTLAALGRDQDLARVTLDEACFIDTETTGLAGGTGTYVFMVGVGRFAGDFFRVDQFFMEDYDREPALIAALGEALRGFGAVVSFNGRAFDLPLIETRFILSRRRPPLRSIPHFDLLPAARRLWGQRLESCRLVALEETILGESRAGDIPGALVPEYYFRYVRFGDPWDVRPIFEHNRRDVLSMVALAALAAERFETFLHGGRKTRNGRDGPDAEIHPVDLFSLGRLYRLLRLREPALRCFEACLERAAPLASSGTGLPAPLADQAALECVRLMRRLGRIREALGLCERLADGWPPRLWALVEMAKVLEHGLRDPGRALAVVDRLIGLLEAADGSGDRFMNGSPPGFDRRVELTPEALGWRRSRLARKTEAAGRSRAAYPLSPTNTFPPARPVPGGGPSLALRYRQSPNEAGRSPVCRSRLRRRGGEAGRGGHDR